MMKLIGNKVKKSKSKIKLSWGFILILGACFRNCFKLRDRRYVEFCLQRKCGGVPFMKAADSLGLVKKPQQQKKHEVAHHHH